MSAAPAAPPETADAPATRGFAGETVAFPATGLGEYRMPADAETTVLKTEAEVYRMDLDLIREHWDDLSDDELVEQAVREYAAMLGRRQLAGRQLDECERTGTKWDPAPSDDPIIDPVPAAPAPAAV